MRKQGYKNAQNNGTRAVRLAAVTIMLSVMMCVAVFVSAGAKTLIGQGGIINAAADVTVWSGVAAAGFESGDGSEDNPYEIASGEQLAYLANLINSGAAGYNLDTVYYRLANDIYLNNTADWENWDEYAPENTTLNKWTPIGDNNTKSNASRFSANFDGGGFSILGIYINTAASCQGLFGVIENGNIKNLGVNESCVNGSNNVGGIAGVADNSSITNCYNTGDIATFDISNSYNYVAGGIVGIISDSNIINCYNTGNISGGHGIGGIAGYVWDNGNITNCYNTGNISGDYNIGGIAGYVWDNGNIINCYNSGSISGSDYIGGIAGWIWENSNIINCYNLGNISGNNTIGGIAGNVYDNCNITNCYNTGNVSGVWDVGGIVGWIWENIGITNSYNAGNISGSNYTGGIAGLVSDISSLVNCYNTGSVSGVESTGGIAGWTDIDSGVVYCYFLQTNNINKGLSGIGNVSGGKTATFGYGGVITKNNGINDINIIENITTLLDALNAWVDNNNSGDGYYNWICQIYPVFNKPFAKGTGTETDPYMISTKEELILMRELINSEAAGYNLDTVYYKLANDIYLNNTAGWENWDKQDPESTNLYKWIPIGDNNTKNNASCFSANFDGGDFSVCGIYINTKTDYQGLFGYIYGGNISNLGIKESYIKGGESVGGIAGFVFYDGSLKNCYNTGSISGDSYVGGIAGEIYYNSSLTDCYNTGNISGDSDVGGIAGDISSNSSLINCYNAGNVFGGNLTGGVIGYIISGSLTNCHNTGSVLGIGYIGGVAGYISSGSLTNCCNFGEISGEVWIGGIAGRASNSRLTNCHNTGDVSGINDVGGVAGRASGSNLTACYNAGDVSGTGNNVGGVVGQIMDGGITVAMTDCYNKGDVSGSGNYTGGVAGYVKTVSLINCFNAKTGGVSGSGYTGGVAGAVYINSSLEGCYNKGIVSGVTMTGGVVGYASDSKLTSCYNTGSISVAGTEDYVGDYTGGIAGLITDSRNLQEIISVESCYNTGDVSGGNYTGGIAGQFRYGGNLPDTETGSVASCYNTGDISGGDYTGGIVGYAKAINFTDCFNDGDISGGGNYIGGVAGDAGGNFTDCYNTGDVSGGGNYTGGVVGFAGGNFTDCYNTGDVSGSGYTGGVWGYFFNNNLINCYNTGDVSGSGYTGGVGGYANFNSNLTSCYNTGDVSGTYDVGGVVGYANFSSNLTNCYNTGDVWSNSYNIGGVAGCVEEGSNLTSCYNTGDVWSNGYNIGGVAGDVHKGSSITSCYNMGDVSGDNTIGGVAGVLVNDKAIMNNSITNCYNSGNVSGNNGSVGGVVGYVAFFSSLTNCYNSGNVSGTERTGGIAGCINSIIGDSVAVINCYNSGNVLGVGYIGGVVGDVDGNVDYCYFLQTNDINKNLNGIGYGSGKTAAFGYGGVITKNSGITGINIIENKTVLLSALNAWVDNNNGGGKYLSWRKVTFDYSGGQGADILDWQIVLHGNKAALPAKPARDCDIFDGWMTSSDGGVTLDGRWDFDADKITADTTLYASWIETPHSYDSIVVTPPTCTGDGYTTYTCTRCGGFYTDDFVSPHGHDWSGEWEVTTAPTTAAEGVLTLICLNDSSHTQTQTLPMLNTTDYEYTVMVEATCGAAGEGKYTLKNTSFGDFSFDAEIPVAAHAWDDWTVGTAPTIAAAGELTRICANDNSHTETQPLPALNTTDYTFTVITEATCTEAGEGKYTLKDIAYGELSFEVEIPALDHDWEWIVTVIPTIAEGGTIKKVCLNDSSHTLTQALPALNTTDYTYTTITEADCETAGVGRYTLKDTSFGDVYFDVETPVIGHAWGDWSVAVIPAAAVEGKLTWACLNDSSHNKTQSLPMLNATDYTFAVITETTCAAAGVGRYTLNDTSFGNLYFDVEIPAKSHEWDAWEDNGDNHGHTCLVCGNKKTAAHTYDGVVTPPTYTSEGFTVYTCTACGHSYTGDNVAKLAGKLSADTDSTVPAGFFDNYVLGETLAAPKREGYTFDGWYKDANFTSPVLSVSAQDLDNDGNIVLYAKWTPDSAAGLNSGLTAGEIAGIAIGSVVVAGLGGFAIFWFAIKKKKFSDLFKRG